MNYQTAEQFGESIGVHADAVRGWCASGEIRAINVAKKADSKKPRWRISETAAAEFLERRTRGPIASSAPSRRPQKKKTGNVIEFF